MATLRQLRETVKAQGLTLEAVAKHATTEEELRRGVREVLAALEAAIWPLEQQRRDG